MDRTHTRRARDAALLGASAIALVFAVAPERARAQDYDRGFQGTHIVNAGSVGVSTATNATTVNVNSPRAVVTWTPTSTATSGTIDFLPEETSATFTSALDDYTILNRIVPGGTAKIGLNGSISSLVSDANSNVSTGGNVWFYTPNGFIIGAGAVMTVGGLLMTTNDVGFTTDQNGGVSLINAAGAVELRGPAGSTGSIVNNGSIFANAYVAMVAPRVEQHGLVSANQSIAYVAGEEVDLTIDAGLFGITVLTGTTDAEGIVHTNTTTGSASTGFLDSKTISFVAIPKNEAMTMLLSGSIGYAPATDVVGDGSAIVLTAGSEGSPDGNIRIGAGEFANQVEGRATGILTVAPESPPPLAEGPSSTVFRSFTSLEGGKSVAVIAAGGTRVQADNSLVLVAGSALAPGEVAVEALGGGVEAGTIAVTGGLSAIAEREGSTSEDGETGADAQGGTVALRALGGAISADYLYLSASADGGYGALQGGDGTGGSVELAAGLGGTITAGSANLYATGHGGQSSGFINDEFVEGRGGVGRGGSIALSDSIGDAATDPDGGTLDLGSVYLSASAVGGNSTFGSGMGGDAFGGTIDVNLDRQDHAISSFYGYAQAQDGDSAVDPIGGDITFSVGGGISLDLSELFLDASATSGINGPAGAFARGGTIDLSVIEGATLRTEFGVNLSARADTALFFGEGLPTSTADLTGGDVTVTADGGNIDAGSIYIDVGATNYGANTRAGFARGGTATVTAANEGSIATRAQVNEGNPFFVVSAQANTGAGSAVGEARGGAITLAALSGGSIDAQGINVILGAAGEARGSISSSGTIGAPAQGGTIAIDAIGGAIGAPIEAYAYGEGGTADLTGGAGTGGDIAVRVLEGGSLFGTLTARAYGSGGQSLSEGDGGDGRGGSFTLTSDALAQFTAFSLDYQGYGRGGEAAAGTGGDGYGGTAQVDLIGGEINWASAILNVSAEGARSQGGASLAGSAFGDEDGARFHAGGGASVTIRDDLLLDASAYTGENGSANEAVGGTATVLVDGGASLAATAITVGATAYLLANEFNPDSTQTTPTVRGGSTSLLADGGFVTAPVIEVVADAYGAGALTEAGTATGGTATLGAANGGSIDVSGSFEFGQLTVQANGYGGEGPSAANAFGGIATIYTQGGSITSPFDLEVRADALAGSYAGFFGEFGIPSRGFDATGGNASVEMRAGGTGSATITVPSLSVSAQGRADGIGSVPGNGGKGTGGTATLTVAEGDLDAGFGIAVLANGYGGAAGENDEGPTAFASGDGEGGTAAFVLSGGTATAARVVIEAIGQGAAGAGFNDGATPLLAGAGTGGSATFRANGGGLTTLGFGEGGGDFTVNGSGYGGEGAFNPDGGAGGAGGSGNGGSALFEAPSGSTADLAISVPIAILADGVGGEAGFSTSETPGTGGNATGGTAAIRLADIPFAFDEVFISGSGRGGFGSTSGTGSGGSAEFSLVDSGSAALARSLGPLTLQATGFAFDGVTPSGAAGALVFTANVGSAGAGLAIEGDLLLDARGASAAAGNGFTGSISGAPVTVGGAVQLTTPRDAALTVTAPGALAMTGDLTIDVGRTFTSTGAISTLANAHIVAPGGISMTDMSSGGSTLLSAVNGPVGVSNDLRSTGLVTVLGRSVNLVSLGALSFADADATAGSLSIRTANDLDLVTVDATGAVSLTSTGGSVRNTGAVNGTDLTFVAGGDVLSETAISANGNLTVDAGGLFVTPDASASATGNVSLSADLGLDLATVVSGGTTVLRSDAGAVNIASLTSPGAVTALGRSVTVASPGALTFASAQATAGGLQLSTGQGLTVGTASATAALLLTTQQLLTINGVATGSTIVTTSGDITIGSSGRLGSRGQTQTLHVTNLSASAPIHFGGAAASGQYSLDQAEAARLFADQSITVAARSSEGGGGDIRIGALAMSYGAASTANIGSGGTLKVDTAGNVTVNGAVALTTSSETDTFSIDPERIDVIAGSGSIAMLGANGVPLGTLVLEGGTIFVAEQSVIDALGSASDMLTIRGLLDQPTSNHSDNGLLQAGSIDFLADEAIYIQNTGLSTATTARRGFTANTVNIDTGSSNTRIVVNGVIAGPSGTLTGGRAIDAITINGAPAAAGGQFNPLSTINGCVVGSVCTSGGAPTSEDLNSPVVNDLGGPGLSGELIQLGENEPLITQPLVDEPITGVGNDDLWQVQCDPEEDKGDCPAGGPNGGEETPE